MTDQDQTIPVPTLDAPVLDPAPALDPTPALDPAPTPDIALATNPAPTPEPIWLTGPAVGPIIIGLLGLLATVAACLTVATNLRVNWSIAGPAIVIGFGVLIIGLGLLGLRRTKA